MTGQEYDDLWICQVCGRRFVIPDFARDCELRHEQEES